MDFGIALKIAIKALLRNKSRTILTMLGIIIGVAAVIAMVSVGLGAQKNSEAEIQASGTNMIMIFAAQGSRGGMHGGFGSTTTLTPADAEAIKQQAKHIIYISPTIRQVVRLIYRNNNWSTALMAGNADYAEIRNWKMMKGRFFSEREVESKMRVVVIGDVVREELFGGDDPIDKIIRINKVSFRVIGVLEPKGQTSFQGNSDDVVVIPFTTAQQRFYKRSYIQMIQASATRMEDTEKAKDEITAILRQRHHLKEGEEDDFRIFTQQDRQQASDQTNQVFTILLGAVASVSLLVGGVGIMNIMLVSVTERIREIGIRMAIGARRRDILIQFLIEAAVLSIVGGLLGVVLGISLSFLIAAIAKFPTVISTPSIFISLGFSVFIGLFFGLYPAWRASKLDPIEALRT